MPSNPCIRTSVLFTWILLCALRPAPVWAQTLKPDGPLPSFDVATIKAWQPMPAPMPPPGEQIIHQQVVKIAPVGGGAQTSDHVRMILNAQQLIASAYGLPFGFEKRVIGGPDWVDRESDRYVIDAKIDAAHFEAMQKMTPEQQRIEVKLMEQTLLADRFRLKVHFETREMPVYALVVTKGGPKLTRAQAAESTRLGLQDNLLTATAVTIDQWIHSPFLGGREVVDQTGLKDRYDFTLTYSLRAPAADAAQSGEPEPPSLFTAMQEQLGLKLEPAKAPVEVIVIDHIERPSAN